MVGLGGAALCTGKYYGFRFVIYLEEDSIFTSSDSVNWWFCRF